jgi:hypothetical protein
MEDNVKYKQTASGRTEIVKRGFSWPAFFFNFLWYIYKGMFGKAIVVFILNVVCAFIFFPIVSIIFSIILGYFGNNQYEDYLIANGYTRISMDDKWECGSCGKTFRTKRDAEKHEKHCKK